jgi:hypothetical protein
MVKTIVNLVESLIGTEIKAILDAYPYYPYRQAFSAPELHHKLVAYVITRTPCLYAVVDESQVHTDTLESLCCSPEQQQQIVDLIHQGIQHILQSDVNWRDQTIPQEDTPGGVPSHWFG